MVFSTYLCGGRGGHLEGEHSCLGGEKEKNVVCGKMGRVGGLEVGSGFRDIFRDRCEGWENDKELLHGAGWCSSCSDDGWLCASVQHLGVRKDALQARDTSQCNLVLATRRNAPMSRM
mgnify:CR=1 FL=1